MSVSKRRKKQRRKAPSPKSANKGQNSGVNAILLAQRTVGNQGVAQVLHAHASSQEAIQRDPSNSAYRQRVIAAKQYKMYLREITHHHPDTRFTNTVRKKWLRILSAYCNGYLTDMKYMTLSDMKYGQIADFDTTIKNMLDITWQRGDDPTILAQKLNRLDDDLNAAKRVVKKMTQPTSFLIRSNVIQFYKKRHNDGSSFLKAGSWSHAFSWKKWFGF